MMLKLEDYLEERSDRFKAHIYALKSDKKIGRLKDEEIDHLTKELYLFLRKTTKEVANFCGITSEVFKFCWESDLRSKVCSHSWRYTRYFFHAYSQGWKQSLLVVILPYLFNFSYRRTIDYRSSNLFVDFHPDNIDLDHDGMRLTRELSDREKIYVKRVLLSRFTKEAYDTMIEGMRVLMSMNDAKYARLLLNLNEAIESTPSQKENYSNPLRRGFMYRFFFFGAFNRERLQYIREKQDLAMHAIKEFNSFYGADKLTLQSYTLQNIRWAVDYNGWCWLFQNISKPAEVQAINQLEDVVKYRMKELAPSTLNGRILPPFSL